MAEQSITSLKKKKKSLTACDATLTKLYLISHCFQQNGNICHAPPPPHRVQD